ncbi:MAG TPA: DUF368 domain-containing protein [Flavobacteriaceae bacterium]|nr:DUF368 domain-containing protein [Flavobacteriaceae bacterium]
MQATRTFSDRIFLVLKGIAMGAANKIPGVSGGMVAFVAGFYEEFIYSLQKINYKALKLILNGRFTSFYRYVNGRFLCLLILGMIISYFSVSLLLDYLIEHYRLFVWSAFFGMIIGSIYYVAKGFDEWNRRNIGLLILGTLLGLSLSFIDPSRENDNLWFVFFCGIIGVSGQTLPGLSGSFILMLLGNYVLLLVDSVNALYLTFVDVFQWDFSFLDNYERIRLLKVLAVFSLGSLVGLVTLSHFLGYLLKHYKMATYAVIIGFITGSLGVVWPWKETIYSTDAGGNLLIDSSGKKIVGEFDRYWPEFWQWETWIAIFFILVGISIVVGLEIYGQKLAKKNG